jgi:hypothetical protein
MEMLELSPEAGVANDYERDLYDEYVKMLGLGAKLFTMRVKAHTEFEFSTTSGDLFMGLGQIGEQGRYLLCLLLEEKFRRSERVFFRVRLPNEAEGKFRAMMLVTMSKAKGDDQLAVFHCSRAHI